MGKHDKTKKKKKKLPPFDKYFYYKESVQGPESDVLYLRDTYKSLVGQQPLVLREDFCGTFLICCEWVKLGPKYKAIGVDLDPEPLAYGKEHYLAELSPSEQERLAILQENVLQNNLAKADIICALNFSYFIFKERQILKNYFQNVYDGLLENGVFIIDCFGGSKCYEANEEETAYEDEKYSYFWDQDNFNPVTNEAQFYIHFKRKGEKKREKVFSYDWRLWSIPELRDIMKEVGFKASHVYWEGTDKNGEGNGIFERTEQGEECESWVAYIAGVK